MLPDVFGETGKRFGVAVRAAFVEVGRPSFHFSRSARSLGVFQDPGQDFAVTLAGSQLFQHRRGVKAEEANKVSVGGGVVDVLPILVGHCRPALVDHTGEDGKTESGVGTTGRALG